MDQARRAPCSRVFPDMEGVSAFYSERGSSESNSRFTFRQSQPDLFKQNLGDLASQAGFDPARLLLPVGGWNHTGTAIKAEEHDWVVHEPTNTLTPAPPVAYDAVATRSSRHVLAVQGADCPTIFLYDAAAGVVAVAHAGWRTLVRGIAGAVVEAMEDLGARPARVRAFVSPGCGDRYSCFGWDAAMAPEIADVFRAAGQEALLSDRSVRRRLTDEDKEVLRRAVGATAQITDETFAVSAFAERRLIEAGLLRENIERSEDSTIVTTVPPENALLLEERPFRYHSYRRDKPKHGLGISVIFLRS